MKKQNITITHNSKEEIPTFENYLYSNYGVNVLRNQKLEALSRYMKKYKIINISWSI